MIVGRNFFLFMLILATTEGQLQDLEQECNILKTLDSLQSRIEEQDIRLREQELNLREQKIAVRELETSLSEKDAQISRLNTDLDDKDTQISRVDTRLDQTDTQISRLDASLNENNARLSRLEEDLGEKEARIGDLETLVDEQKAEVVSLKQRLDSVHAVGFSTKTPRESPSSPGQMTFKTIFTNAGDGYDSSTGVFACPVAGTYFFCAALLKLKTYNGSAACELFKNDERLVRAYTSKGDLLREGDYGFYSAVTAVYVRLTVGDIVTLKRCTDIEASFSHESSFSGFLVTPDDD